jgi:hypothetical protein
MSGKGLSINTVENINLLTNTLNIDSTITNINSISTNINSNIYFNSDMIFTNNNILNSLKNIPDLSEGDTLIYGPSDKFITIQNFSYVCPTIIGSDIDFTAIDGKYNIYNVESRGGDFVYIRMPSINSDVFINYNITFCALNRNLGSRAAQLLYSSDDVIHTGAYTDSNPLTRPLFASLEETAFSINVFSAAPNKWVVLNLTF